MAKLRWLSEYCLAAFGGHRTSLSLMNPVGKLFGSY